MNMENTPETVYLVDLENIGTRFLCEYMEQYPNAKYIIFYSDATPTPGSVLEQSPETVQVEFVECKFGGNNAMDFCISAMAGRLTVDKRNIVRILSNDKGYDPMLYMLHEQGIRIKRRGIATQAAQKTVTQHVNQPETTQQQESTSLIKAIRDNVPKQYQQEVMNTLPDAVSRKEAHEMLQAILPQKIVAETYKKLKKYIPKEVV